jgi:glycosyltransferase involved in cell wall biosynthesis
MDGIRVVRVMTFIAPNRGLALRTLDFCSYMVAGFTAGLFERAPDVVIATSPQFFAAVGGWALAAARRVPFVFELGDLWPASIRAVGALPPGAAMRALERVELFLYERAAAVVALTEAFQRDLVDRGVRADKIAVVRNGVDLPRFQPRPRDRELARELDLEGRTVVGYIGTHGMAHDLGNAIAAAALLRERGDIAFLFVGSGAERQRLIQRAERDGATGVRFVPLQPKHRVPAYWSLCDLALIQLRADPVFSTVIPSKLFEAMAMGIPALLVAPEGEASELVRREQAGWVVPPGRPESLASAVAAIADDADERARRAHCGLAAAPRYSREQQARRMIDVCEAILAGRPAAGATP